MSLTWFEHWQVKVWWRLNPKSMAIMMRMVFCCQVNPKGCYLLHLFSAVTVIDVLLWNVSVDKMRWCVASFADVLSQLLQYVRTNTIFCNFFFAPRIYFWFNIVIKTWISFSCAVRKSIITINPFSTKIIFLFDSGECLISKQK